MRISNHAYYFVANTDANEFGKQLKEAYDCLAETASKYTTSPITTHTDIETHFQTSALPNGSIQYAAVLVAKGFCE